MKNSKYILSIILSLAAFQASADYKIIFNKLDNIPEPSKTPEEIISEYNNEWLTFFEMNCNNPFADESALETSGDSVTCRNIGLNDEDLPQGGLKTTAALFNFASNNLKDLSAFKDVEKGHYFNFSGNPITSLDNLSSLKDVNVLSFYSTPITDLSGLENATRINVLDLRLSSNLSDITALENVQMTRLTMDSVFFEKTGLAKMPSTSLFCESLRSGSGYVTLDGTSTSNKASVLGKICELTPEEETANAGEWLYFLSAKCNGEYKNLTELQTGDETIDCRNNNVESEWPQGGLQETASNFDFRSNNLQTLSPFKDVEKAHVLNFGNNPVSSLMNLSSLREANALSFYASSLSNLDGLENATRINSLDVRESSNLSDITALENVQMTRLTMDSAFFEQTGLAKMPSNSLFCESLRSGSGYVTIDGTSTSNKASVLGKICELTPEEETANAGEWLYFLSAKCNGEYKNLTELQTGDETIDCRNNNVESEWPQGGLQETASNFDFRSNNLQTLSPFKDVEKAHVLNFGNNPVSSLMNLSSLREANALSFYASSLSNLDGLENATRINSLDVRESSNLSDITALENVQMTRLTMDSAFFEQTGLAKMPSTSLFCENLRSGSGYVTLDGTSTSNKKIVFGKICELTLEEETANAGEWLYFLSSKCDSEYKNLSELETGTDTVTCRNNFTDSDLPQGGLQNSKSYFTFYANNLQTLSSFKDVVNAHVLHFGNNNINSLANLANLQNATYLVIYGNPDITDLSPISDASIKRLYIDESQINNLISKLPQSSAFCQNLSNNVGYLYVMSTSGNGIREDLESSVCNF